MLLRTAKHRLAATRCSSNPTPTCILCLYPRFLNPHQLQKARYIHSWSKRGYGNAAPEKADNDQPEYQRFPSQSVSPTSRFTMGHNAASGVQNKWNGSLSSQRNGYSNDRGGKGHWIKPMNPGSNAASSGYNRTPPTSSIYQPAKQSQRQSASSLDFLDQVMRSGRGTGTRHPAWPRRSLPQSKTEQNTPRDALPQDVNEQKEQNLDKKSEETILPLAAEAAPAVEQSIGKKNAKNIQEEVQRDSRKGRDKGRRGFGVMGTSCFVDEFEASAEEAKKAKKKKKREQPIPLLLPEYISVANLAGKLKQQLEPFMEKLAELGFEGLTHDYVLNVENAGLIAMEFNHDPIVEHAPIMEAPVADLVPRPPPEDKSVLPPRPPVVTIMGHVDHGKTTLLDCLRKSAIAASEHGGITQHIGAFSVTMPSGKVITFLDTPGHAAFLSMRERGANATDIVILVVAGDDSVKPQTLEALKHAKAANVPIIVAVSKCDKPDANIEKVKQDLIRWSVEIEDIGGDTQVIPVSGKSGQGMEDLEEAIIALAEVLDMRAEIDGPCEGWILEAATKKRGRVATVLVRRGTLKQGDIIVAGQSWARVRSLINEQGRGIRRATPGTPVEVDGWKDQPNAGDIAIQVESEERAKNVVSSRRKRAERLRQAADMEAINQQRQQVRGDIEQEKLLSENPELSPKATEDPSSKCRDIPFIIKADVSGSAEAVVNTVSAMGNGEVRAKILRSSFGPVTQFDIGHAATANGFVLAFNIPVDPDISSYAGTKGVEIIQSNIIYELQDTVHAKLSEFLPPKITHHVTGEALVLKLFRYEIRKKVFHTVVGCLIKQGSMKRNSKIKVLRNDEAVYYGTLSSLKNGKKEVSEMKKDKECGISFDDWQTFQENDILQCYEEEVEIRKLPPITYGQSWTGEGWTQT